MVNCNSSAQGFVFACIQRLEEETKSPGPSCPRQLGDVWLLGQDHHWHLACKLRFSYHLFSLLALGKQAKFSPLLMFDQDLPVAL